MCNTLGIFKKIFQNIGKAKLKSTQGMIVRERKSQKVPKTVPGSGTAEVAVPVKTEASEGLHL